MFFSRLVFCCNNEVETLLGKTNLSSICNISTRWQYNFLIPKGGGAMSMGGAAESM